MQQNCEDFSIQEALRLAKSPAGQQLLAMLRQGDQDQLQQVMALAKAGDLAQASTSLRDMLASQQAQKLLRQMEEERHG